MSGELLRESLEDLYENAPCGYIFTLPDGAIARVNETFVAWTGYSREALAITRFQELLTIPGRIFYENQYAPLLRMQGFVNEVSFDLRCNDGRRLPVLVNSTLRTDADGQPTLIASIIFDATDRDRYEQELRIERARAEQLATIVTSAGDAIIRTTPDGTIETWNAGAARLFSYAAQEIVGTSVWDLLPSLGTEADQEQIIADLRAGRPVYRDGVGRRADGNQVDVSIGLMPLVGLLGELDAISAILRDISERRAVERLQQEFLAMTSHELRHPLTSIRGQAQLLHRREQYSPRAVETIIEQTDRLGRLIDDLLLASLMEADRFDVRTEPVDVVHEVRLAVGQLQSAEHPIHIDTQTDSVVIVGDRQRLGQVFSNLISNARKYSPNGSDITIRIRDNDDSVRVDIIDQGIGIAQEDVSRLFTRFFRAEGSSQPIQGLGLGLYITRRIIVALGGTIAVESQVGTGSTFTVTLPRQHTTAR
jgi:PAS domain S-box-containing protein